MRVLVDALICGPGSGGIGTYARNLCEALGRRADAEVFVWTSMPRDEFPGCHVVPAPGRSRHPLHREAWRALRVHAVERATRPDIYISVAPESAPRLRSPIPRLITVYDLRPEIFPAWTTPGQRLRHRLGLKAGMARCSGIVCASESTALNLIGGVAGDDPRIRVIRGAAPAHVPAPAGVSWPDAPDVVYIGEIFTTRRGRASHKNVSTLIRAIGVLARQGRPLTLGLAGPLTPQDKHRLDAEIHAVDASDVATHLGFLPRPTLLRLVGSATMLALPSLSEGFGLPILEAMSLGVPVVAADVPASRETAGEAAVFVTQPRDAERWADALWALAQDPREQARLRAAGLATCGARSWSDVADEYLALARELGAGA